MYRKRKHSRLQSSFQNYQSSQIKMNTRNNNLSSINLQRVNKFPTSNRRYKSQASEYEEKSFQKIRKSLNINLKKQFKYNKWFMKPQERMVKPMNDKKIRRQKFQNNQFIYNKLYEQKIVDERHPFEYINNDKLQFLKKMPSGNFRLLQNFKRSQQQKKKRVPKIVYMFLNQNLNNQRRTLHQ